MDAEFTQEQKIRGYVNAYFGIMNGTESYMCTALIRHLQNTGHITEENIQFVPDEKVFEYFPEVLKYKPNDVELGHSWFPKMLNGRYTRLEILKEIISKLSNF